VVYDLFVPDFFPQTTVHPPLFVAGSATRQERRQQTRTGERHSVAQGPTVTLTHIFI
jgi:hypothetical protein